MSVHKDETKTIRNDKAAKIQDLFRKNANFVSASFLAVFFAVSAQAVQPAGKQELPFAPGEQWYYNIHYKWGFIMAKAGTAYFSINKSQYNSQPTYLSTLTFKTTSTFDKIFKVRDTLRSHVNTRLEPLFHEKFLHEGNTHYKEILEFKKFGNKESKALSIRYDEEGAIRFEKELEAPEPAFDMVSIFILARTLDYHRLISGTELSISSFVGRDRVKMNIRYIGQEILEKSSSIKYKTLKLEVDIIDEAFETSKKAMEMWISDDPNRIPIKIKAKLKIGSAEAELGSYKGIKYPLSSLVIIKPRN